MKSSANWKAMTPPGTRLATTSMPKYRAELSPVYPAAGNMSRAIRRTSGIAGELKRGTNVTPTRRAPHHWADA